MSEELKSSFYVNDERAVDQKMALELFKAKALIGGLRKELAALREANRWIPVEERLPEDGAECLVCVPASKYEEAYRTIDMLEEGVWQAHYANYEHFEAIGGSNAIPFETSTGPSEEAPYTHWMPIPLLQESDDE